MADLYTNYLHAKNLKKILESDNDFLQDFQIEYGASFEDDDTISYMDESANIYDILRLSEKYPAMTMVVGSIDEFGDDNAYSVIRDGNVCAELTADEYSEFSKNIIPNMQEGRENWKKVFADSFIEMRDVMDPVEDGGVHQNEYETTTSVFKDVSSGKYYSIDLMTKDSIRDSKIKSKDVLLDDNLEMTTVDSLYSDNEYNEIEREKHVELEMQMTEHANAKTAAQILILRDSKKQFAGCESYVLDDDLYEEIYEQYNASYAGKYGSVQDINALMTIYNSDEFQNEIEGSPYGHENAFRDLFMECGLYSLAHDRDAVLELAKTSGIVADEFDLLEEAGQHCNDYRNDKEIMFYSCRWCGDEAFRAAHDDIKAKYHTSDNFITTYGKSAEHKMIIEKEKLDQENQTSVSMNGPKGPGEN